MKTTNRTHYDRWFNSSIDITGKISDNFSFADAWESYKNYFSEQNKGEFSRGNAEQFRMNKHTFYETITYTLGRWQESHGVKVWRGAKLYAEESD